MAEFQEAGLGPEELARHGDDDHVAVADVAVGAVLRTGYVLFDDGVAGQRPVELEALLGVDRRECGAGLVRGVDAGDVHAAAGVDRLDDGGQAHVRTGGVDLRGVADDGELRLLQAGGGDRLTHLRLVPDQVDGGGVQAGQTEPGGEQRGGRDVVLAAGDHGVDGVLLVSCCDRGLEGGVVVRVHGEDLCGQRAHGVGDYAAFAFVGGD